mmetsp:Transcript_7539/g.18709  ORF Transcript_7539/g.18709 Transcript_7539/m.18709 type:complete len:204 (-) Transcript_7539:139-750(-)
MPIPIPMPPDAGCCCAPPPPPPCCISASAPIRPSCSSLSNTELASFEPSVSRMIPPSQCSSINRKTSSRLSSIMFLSVAPPMSCPSASYMPSARCANRSSDSPGGPTWTTRTSPAPPPPPPPPWEGADPPQNTAVLPRTVTTSALSGRAVMPPILDWSCRSKEARSCSTLWASSLAVSAEEPSSPGVGGDEGPEAEDAFMKSP